MEAPQLVFNRHGIQQHHHAHQADCQACQVIRRHDMVMVQFINRYAWAMFHLHGPSGIKS